MSVMDDSGMMKDVLMGPTPETDRTASIVSYVGGGGEGCRLSSQSLWHFNVAVPSFSLPLI